MKASHRGNPNQVAVLLLIVCMTACSGNSIQEETPALSFDKPLAENADQRLTAALDWIVVRGGPGSWVEDADWDEYILRVTNTSERPLRISDVHVVDSLGTTLRTTGQRPDLIKQSKASVKRYKGQGLSVKAGAGGDALVATGTVVLAASYGVGVSVLTGSMAATTATTTAVAGAYFIAPLIIIGGLMINEQDTEIAAEIIERQVKLPMMLAAGETRSIHLFFPLAPSPQMIVIDYVDTSVEKELVIKTREQLAGLHMDDQSGSARQ